MISQTKQACHSKLKQFWRRKAKNMQLEDTFSIYMRNQSIYIYNESCRVLKISLWFGSYFPTDI